MIRLHIIERPEARLRSTLAAAMRAGELRTFHLEKGGRRVVHERYRGWMTWADSHGVIACEINSRRPGEEWQFLRAFIGRLADRYAEKINSITILFPEAPVKPARSAKARS